MDSISAFGRRVGLTPSALRFYDDCSILRPARVDPRTGYRYYSESQVERARLLRALRTAGMPLAEVTVVLNGSPADAREALLAHAGRIRREAGAAEDAIDELLRALPGSGSTRVRVGGPELAAAVRQVAPAAAPDGEHEALRCVLVEYSGTAVRLVATDRYRLSVRELAPLAVDGEPGSVLVPVDALTGSAAWATRAADVTLAVAGQSALLEAGSDRRDLPLSGAVFPAYRQVLTALGPARHRVIVARAVLLAALTTTGSPAWLELSGEAASLGGTRLPAVCSGHLRVAFDPATLGAAVEAGSGRTSCWSSPPPTGRWSSGRPTRAASPRWSCRSPDEVATARVTPRVSGSTGARGTR